MNRKTHPISYLICCLIAAASILTGAHAANNPGKIKIIYTNDTLGYLEPCGCGGRYQGGLARRTTAIAKLLEADANTVVIDSGNITNMESKLALIISLMAGMKYDAVGIGGADKLFTDEFFKQTAKNGLKVIDTTRPKSASTVPSITKQINGVKVGVVSYGKPDTTSEDHSVFYSAYKAARDSSDLLILLDQGGIATTQWLTDTIARLGAPDIVIGGASKGIIATDKVIGKTHVVPLSQLGMLLGTIDVDMSNRKSPVITAEMLALDKKYDEDEAVKKLVQDFVQVPKTLAAFSPTSLNFGSIKKGTKTEEYVTLAPLGASQLTITKTGSSTKRITAPTWTRNSDGSYRVKIVIDAGNTPGRVLETISLTLDQPGEPTLNLRVFGNVTNE